MKRIIPLYIIREIIPAFLANLLVFTFILLLTKMLELTELIVVKGITPVTILKLLLNSIPFLLSLTVPMSTLLAVLLAFSRLSSDNEITVLKSAGIGLYQLMPPVVLFCLWTCLITSHLALTLVPQANGAFRNELLALAKTRAEVSIKERIFNEDFKDMVLFVNHIPMGSNFMENIFIQDERDEEMVNVVTASRGRIVTDRKQRNLILQLFDGVVDRVDRRLETSETIDYKRYDLKLDLESALSKENLMKPDQYEMSQDDLWAAIENFKREDTRYFLYLMEAHKRYALPFSCLVLGLVAIPLGIQVRSRGR
ncbi:MAG: LptF/LptG family permease, partial [Proteobacteria bacterium]|nr:LptF/LptG family permease [Pseudomonadota bacterium]